jgi:hypothetical protein
MDIIASIESDIAAYSEDFLRSVGKFFTTEWDQGSSWEVLEVEGKKQIVRKEPKKKEVKKGHLYSKGQTVHLIGTLYPVTARIVELVGDKEYTIKTEDGSFSTVEEADLALSGGQQMFDVYR